MPSPAPFALPFAPRRVLIGSGLHAPLAAWIRERRPELDVIGAKFDEIAADELAWAEVYIGFKRPPSDPSLGTVRWVHGTGAGVDGFLLPEPIDPSILLTRSPERFGPMIAEWAVGRVLAFQLQIIPLFEQQRAKLWHPLEVSPVAGTRALVVGTGEIGSAVAAALGALGCVVTGVSRTGAPHPAFREVHPVAELPRLVGEAEWIVLTVPDTPLTRGLVSRELLSRCRGAVLLNAGRGRVVEESVLPEALEQGWLKGAALDVFETEPLPASSPLWDDPRVMISPHISGTTTVRGAGEGFLECLAELEAGRLPKWTVDRARGY